MVRWDIIKAQGPLYFLLQVCMVIMLGSFSGLSLLSIWLLPADLGVPLKLAMPFAVILVYSYILNELWVRLRRREIHYILLGLCVAALAVIETAGRLEFLIAFAVTPIAPTDLTRMDLYLKIFASLPPTLALLVVVDGVLWLTEKVMRYVQYRKWGP
jgi:hypothetical protein